MRPPAVALLATLLGFGWRARDLTGQSFWWDEAYSAVVARGSLRSIVETIAAADFHPPLHYVLFHYWRVVAGESEYSLRYTAALVGAAIIPLAFATGRRLFGRPAVGALAASLCAASPMLVYYATEARMFALAAMLALLLTYLGHRAATRGAWRDWALVGIMLAGGAYNYYYAVLAAGPIGLLAAFHGRRALTGYAAAIGAAVLLYLPWLPIAFGRTVEWTSPWTGPTTPDRVLAWTWPALMTGIPALELWDDRRLSVLLGTTLAAAIGLTAAGLLLRDRAVYTRGIWYAAIATAVPLGAMAAIALVRPIYHPRYAIAVAPALCLLLAGAIGLPSRWLLPVRAALTIAVALSFGWGLWRYYQGDGVTRDDYRSAVGYLTSHARPGDVAMTNALPGLDYYDRGPMPRHEFPPTPYEESAIVAELNRLSTGHRRLWYLTHDLRPSDPERFVDLQLARRTRPLEARRFGQLRVALFELADPPGFAALPFQALAAPASVGDDLMLVGLGLDNAPALAGDELPLTLRWRVRQTPSADLGVFARLRDDQGFAWGREDRRPRDAAFRLSSGWAAGADVTTRHGIPIAPGTPPGRYSVEIGAYRLDTLEGLEVRGDGRTRIGQSIAWSDVAVESNPASTGDPTLRGPGGPIDEAVALVASGLAQDEANAGATVDLTLLWKARAPPGPRERVLRLLGSDGRAVAETRALPTGGRHSAERWLAGELVRDQMRLHLPPGLGSGSYRVWAGLAPPGGEPRGLELGALRVNAVARQTALPPIANPREVDFGDGVRMLGWEMERVAPSRLRVTLFWRPSGTPTRDYRVFNHLVDSAERIVAQRDGAPVGWTRPTTGWVAGEAIVDPYELDVPAGAGPLTLRIGVYEPVSGRRLMAGGTADHVDLTVFPG